MTPADEDALVEQFSSMVRDKNGEESIVVTRCIRLAIRAAVARGKSEAVAQERERAIGRVEDCLRGSHWDAERLAVVAAIAGEPK